MLAVRSYCEISAVEHNRSLPPQRKGTVRQQMYRSDSLASGHEAAFRPTMLCQIIIYLYAETTVLVQWERFWQNIKYHHPEKKLDPEPFRI